MEGGVKNIAYGSSSTCKSNMHLVPGRVLQNRKLKKLKLIPV